MSFFYISESFHLVPHKDNEKAKLDWWSRLIKLADLRTMSDELYVGPLRFYRRDSSIIYFYSCDEEIQCNETIASLLAEAPYPIKPCEVTKKIYFDKESERKKSC